MNHQKTDKQILRERRRLYGPADLQWKTIGRIHRSLEDYFQEIYGAKVPGDEHEAHLACLKEAVLKIIRSIAAPGHVDNYQDGRNYLTIAEQCIENQR